MWRHFTVSLCVLFATQTIATNLTTFYNQEPDDSKDLLITKCVKNIVKKIVSNSEFTMDVNLLSIDDKIQVWRLHKGIKGRFVTRSFSWNKNKISNSFYITSTSNIQEFKNGMELAMHDYYFNAHAKFIIVLDHFDKADRSDIIQYLVSFNIYDVSIVSREDGNVYAFESPIHPCGGHHNISPVTHCSTYKENPMYLQMGDIRGCRFQLMTYNLFPLINLDDPNEEGVYQRILNYFQDYAGITIDLIRYARVDKMGKIVANFSYTDILDKVISNEVEGAVGGYFVGSTTDMRFSSSYPLDIEHMLVILPRAKLLDTWHGFFATKAKYVIVMVYVVFACFSIAAYFLSLFPSHKHDFIADVLTVFGYFTNRTTVRKLRFGVAERIIMASFLFAILIIPYTMQSYMWSIKTNPGRGYEMKDFDEVARTKKLTINSVWSKEGLTKERVECFSIVDCIKLVRDDKHQAFYTLVTDETYETFKWMAADEQCYLGFYKLQQHVGNIMRAIHFRRGSVLQHPFNDFFFKIMSAGLVDHHYDQISFKERIKCRPQFYPKTVPLNMTDFYNAYCILVVGYCVSFIVFVFEVLPQMSIFK